MKLKWNYLGIPAIVTAIALIGKFFTQAGMDWYRTINLPSYTPAGWFIGLMWQTIYVLVIASLLMVWNKMRHTNKFWNIISIFAINGILNLSWSFVFFYNNAIKPGVFVAGMIGITVAMLIGMIYKEHKVAALLLVPYLVWVSFATYLNLVIGQLN